MRNDSFDDICSCYRIFTINYFEFSNTFRILLKFRKKNSNFFQWKILKYIFEPRRGRVHQYRVQLQSFREQPRRL